MSFTSKFTLIYATLNNSSAYARHSNLFGTCRFLFTVSGIRIARGYYRTSSNQCLTFPSTWADKKAVVLLSVSHIKH